MIINTFQILKDEPFSLHSHHSMDLVQTQERECNRFGPFCKEAEGDSTFMDDGDIKQDLKLITCGNVEEGDNDKSLNREDDSDNGESAEQCVNANSPNKHSKKRVSFNGSLTEEIDIDFCQLGFNCWTGVPKFTKDEVLAEYRAICNQHHVDVEDEILTQLSVIQNNWDFSAMLNLLDTRITQEKLEIYEKLFQLVNFNKLFINVDLLENEAIIEIFHMIEYYNSVRELILYGDCVHDCDLWASVAVAASNSDNDLTNISINELKISDGGLMLMFDNINENPHIEVLRFNGCQLNFTPTFSIATPLKNNHYLKELHLCNVQLYYKETTILALFIRDNRSLKVLNLSNNKIGDRGFKVLVNALVEQARSDIGIAAFLAVNNRLTKAISTPVQILMEQCPLLQALNVGCNNLTDEFLIEIKDSLEKCESLQALGLQSALLTHDGIIQLMEVCKKNRVLQHINLRGNRALQHDALHTLTLYLPHTNLLRIDLDDANRFCTDTNQYIEILNNIRKLLLVKVMNEPPSVSRYSAFGPELSLSCDMESLPRSTWKIPRNKGRFEIVSVPDTSFASAIPSINANTSCGDVIVSRSPPFTSSQKANWSSTKACENVECVDQPQTKGEETLENNNNNGPTVEKSPTESEVGMSAVQKETNSSELIPVDEIVKEDKKADEFERPFRLTCDNSVIFIGHNTKDLVTISNKEPSLELSIDSTAFESIISKELFSSSKCSVEVSNEYSQVDTFPENSSTENYTDVSLISDDFYSGFNISNK